MKKNKLWLNPTPKQKHLFFLLYILLVTLRLELLPLGSCVLFCFVEIHYYLSASESVHTYPLGVCLFLIVTLMLFLPVCQVWSLAMVATDLCLGPKSDPDLEIPWAQHPFGRQLLESL